MESGKIFSEIFFGGDLLIKSAKKNAVNIMSDDLIYLPSFSLFFIKKFKELFSII